MSRYGFGSTLAAIGAAVALLTGIANARDQVYYTVTDLGVLPGGLSSRAAGINNRGEVVGFADVPGPISHAFLYSNGSMADLGTLGGQFSYGHAINDSGQVVGSAQNYLGGYMQSQPFLDADGTMVDLGGLAGATLNPFAMGSSRGINNLGQVVGESQTATGVQHAFLYTNGTMHDLGTLTGYGGKRGSSAQDINDNGLIVGYSWVSSSLYHAFLYSDWTMTDLGTLPGYDESEATRVNNNAQVVGQSVSTVTGYRRPFLYSNGTMTDLGTLGGNYGWATGVNDAGQVVGNATTAAEAEGFAHPFIYSNGVMTDLLSLLGPAWSGAIMVAEDINDAGWIAASASVGFGPHALILKPAMPGDANLDGTVDVGDLSRVLANFDHTGAAWADGDFDGDATVGIADLSKILTNFDQTPALSGKVAAVPEPSVLRLLAMAAMCLPIPALVRPRCAARKAAKARRARSAGLVAFFGLPLLVSAAHASGAVRYSVTDLGTLGGQYNQAKAINDIGRAAGNSNTPDGMIHGALYDNGRVVDLGTFGGSLSWAFDINNSGQVVGKAGTADGKAHAFLYSNGTTADLGALGYSYSGAYGINDSGQVVGVLQDANGPEHAFLYSNGTMTELSMAPGVTGSSAQAINNSGQIVGMANRIFNGIGQGRGFLYSNGTITELGTLGGPNSYAVAINNKGQVAGRADTTEIDPKFGYPLQRAFLYSDGTMTDLGTLGGVASTAYGMNDSGQVVGVAENAAGQARPVLFSNGTATDLNSLIDPALGWSLSVAYAINNNGWIVGSGDNALMSQHAFLMRPATPGDANLDGFVDILDLDRVLSNFDHSGMAWGDGDFDGDGIIEIADLTKLLTNFDMSPGASLANMSAVPEPPSWILLISIVIVFTLCHTVPTTRASRSTRRGFPSS
jgi:probable HAF family extracellular repeat protein